MSTDSITIHVASLVPATLTHPAVVVDGEGIPHDLHADCLVTIGGQPADIAWVDIFVGARDNPLVTLTIDPERYDRVIAADFH